MGETETRLCGSRGRASEGDRETPADSGRRTETGRERERTRGQIQFQR